MSIVTKTGDDGTTGLMYNRRVPKNHPRIEACGTVDELNAALGLAKAASGDEHLRETLMGIQKNLVNLMGELATDNADAPRYAADGYARLTGEQTAGLEVAVRELEGQKLVFRGWATPGENAEAGALDFARTICRRAERRVCTLQQEGLLMNAEIPVFLNRLSDLLWLLARRAEQPHASGPAKFPSA
jgi:cob(I)alamin adenosyltransferase